jgi:hypothetical protein
MMDGKLIKIARTQMRAVVVKLLKEQNGVCYACKEPIDLKIPKEGVLDHCHESGEIRGVMHRWCNGQLGKIENAAIRAKRGGTYKGWLVNAINHILTCKTGLMYPSHKTDEEKRAERALKEKKRRAEIKAREVMAQRAKVAVNAEEQNQS